MLNLLKADIYKLKRSKSFYICLGIIALFVAYVVFDFKSSEHIKESFSPSTFHWIYMFFQETSFLPYFIPALQAIFITMLITTEYSTGTVKDSVSLGFRRTNIYLSKLITVSIGTVIIMVVAVLSTIITSMFVFGIYGSFTMHDLFLLIRMLLVQVLLYTAYGSMFLLIAFLIKDVGGTMAFSILFSLTLGSLSSVLGNSSFGRIFLLMNFSPTALPQPNALDLKIALIVGISYLVICTGIGGFLFKKQDIK